jgi:hypothetical protein
LTAQKKSIIDMSINQIMRSKMSNFLTKGFQDAVSKMRGIVRATPGELARLNTKIDELTQQRDAIAEELRDNIEFEQIFPDKNSASLHKQLLENERVHQVDNVEELVEKRVGGAGDNKRCFARVSRNGDPLVTAGIYTALVDITGDNENFSYGDLPGNINDIKDLEVEPFEAKENTKRVAAILYTISSASKHSWDKGGRPLAKAVYQYLKGEAEEQGYEVYISTLSPLRNVPPWLDKQNGLQKTLKHDGSVSEAFMAFMSNDDNKETLKHLVIKYLLLENDPVLNFHLGNGAFIGDIKFNDGNNQDPIMINYVYPNSEQQLDQNSEFYKKSKIKLLAPHLQSYIGLNPDMQSKAASHVSMNEATLGKQPAFKPL